MAPAGSTNAPDSPWGAYPDTILDFPELDLRVDLRRPLEQDMATLLRQAVGPAFAVVTADFPLGVSLDETEHAARFGKLRTLLDEEDHLYVRADGLSVDGTHRERGVAVVITQEDAREIARRFEQLGIFWFDGSAFWLVPVLQTGETTKLPLPHSPSGDQ